MAGIRGIGTAVCRSTREKKSTFLARPNTQVTSAISLQRRERERERAARLRMTCLECFMGNLRLHGRL